ncbi:MAG: DMT family transporter [Cyanobacteria bacterium SZAS LIN-2]|nr:DMT family transporter [Cyanobacteria bacterium SZAS LIN-2]
MPKTGVFYGLAAALLFALSTPLAKVLLDAMPPLMLAALLYSGSGLGLALMALFRGMTARPTPERSVAVSELKWLSPAIICGGILAPIAMMQGLALGGAAASSMLLNLEGVFTALIAWIAFKENVDRRVFCGMVSILLGGFVLTFRGLDHAALAPGSLLIVLACLLWALDNNFCRKVCTSDSVLVAMAKGLIAGGVNLGIALACGQQLPPLLPAALALGLGFLSYGLSLVSYLTAQRYLGTARTGAYFASAPFIAALLAMVFLHEPLTLALSAASLLMALGIWLHLTERHSHTHVHEAIEHTHLHYHDDHHQHGHETEDIADGSAEAHTHWHRHERMEHAHGHYPDSHHEHTH